MTEEFKQVSGEAETVADTEAMDGAVAAAVEGSTGSDTGVGQAARIINPPPAGQTDSIKLAPGEHFELAANPAGVSLVVDGNNLVLGFDLDGNGTPDSFVLLEDLVVAASGGNPPVLMVAGEPIGVDLLVGNALALSGPQAGGPGATLETAAGEADGAQGSGATAYSDNLGDAIDLLVAQGVIPPVELQFGLTEIDDRIDILVEDNDPPVADPVQTPASQADGGEGGGLPEDLLDALNDVVFASETVTVAGDFLPGSVQYIKFSLSEMTTIRIAANSTEIDPEIFLFNDDGALDIGDFIATDDDSGPGLNSLLEITLPVGNYTIAVSDFALDLGESVSGINGIATTPGEVSVTVSEVISDDSIVFFKQLDVDASISDDDSGVIADFGGADSETSLENLVFTLQSNPTFGQLILVTAGGDTSFLTPGDTFSSGDTVWWIATEEQIAPFLAQPGAPEFLPNVDFVYSVTDEDGGVATAPVVITLPPPTDPRASLSIFQDDCLNEDTEGALLFSASPTDGASKIDQIIISDFPTGEAADAWVVDASSVNIFGYTLGVDYTASYNATTGELTINFVTANFSLGEGVQGTVNVTPNPDSDVDVTLTIDATAINGAGSATDTESSPIEVDADADGAEGGPGEDNDDDDLSIRIDDISDSDDDGESFQVGESGTITVTAAFDDFLDGSETHEFTVTAPTGFTIDDVTAASLPLPPGVSYVLAGDGSSISFSVPADAVDGRGGLTVTLDITNVSAGDGSHTFEASATATETLTGDHECDPEDNTATVDDEEPVLVATVAPPVMSLDLYGADDCIEEDSALNDINNQVAVTVNPDGDDLLTEIVITGLQSDWTYDFTGLGGAGVDVDTTVAGQVTITFDSPSSATYNGTFSVQPPADSDADHPTITVSASVEDPNDAALTADGSDTIDIHVDAAVDGGALVSGAPGTSDGGAVVDLNLTLDPQGGNPGNPTGDAHNGGSFDTDGSESVTKVVVTLSGTGVTDDADGNLLFDDSDLSITTTHAPGSLVWAFEGSETDLAALIQTLQVDPADDFEGDINVKVDVTTTEVATEAGSPLPEGDGTNGVHGHECDDENNSVTESFNFPVPVDNAAEPVATIGIEQGDCLFEDTEGTLAFTADPQGDGDTITQIVISGFPASWDADTASLQLDGLATPADYTFSLVGGVLTINLTGAAADATVTGTINVTPNEDSDLDASLTINATAEDGEASSTSDNDPTVIPVDAVADGGAYMDGTPDSSTDGSVADLNLTLTPRGHASGTPDDENPGGFDTDGSESVTKVVVTLSGDAGAVLTSSNLVLFDGLLTSNVGQVWTFEGSEADLVTLMASLQVNPSDSFEGDVGIQVDVTTTEFATVAGNPDAGDTNGVHGDECTDANNSVTETFDFTVTVADGADPTGGTLSLIVDEEALDEVQDAADLQAGTTTGTDSGSIAETDSDTLVFNAGGDPIVDIYFGSTAGIVVKDEALADISVNWTLNGDDRLIGDIGGVTVIVLELSGDNSAAAGGTANVAVTATLTDAFPHAFGESGDVTITGIEVDAEDSDGDIGTGTVDVTVMDDEPEAGTPQTLIISNSLGLSGTADLDFVLGADGPGGFSLTKAMASDGTQTNLVESAAVYGVIEGTVQQLTSNGALLVWHDNGDGSWSAIVTGDTSAVAFTVSVNLDGTYTVALDDEPLDGAFSEFELAFTSGVTGGNNDQLIFFDSTAPDASPADGIPDGSTVMALATAFDSDGTVGTVNSSTNGMGVSEGNTIDVNDVDDTPTSEVLFLDFGEPVDPAEIDGRNDPQFTPRLITFAAITFNILDAGEFAIVGVYIDGVVDPVYFKVAGFGTGASAASDEVLTIDQGATGDGSLGGTGTLADPFVVDMNGQFGTAYVDGSFATLEFQADVATDTDYRLLSAQGIDITSGTDIATSFTAEAIDDDGDTAEAVFDMTFDAGNDLVGTAGSDVIVDDGGDNTITDDAGPDIIIGGDGADIINLANDGDTDILVYDAASEAGDVVTGFDVDAAVLGGVGGDVIDVVDLLDTGDFTGTSLSEAMADGYVTLTDNLGNAEIWVDVDGSAGGGAAVLVATLNGINVVDLNDNIVVD